MPWMNYHHLFYFWTVAKRGSITQACKELRLSQPTVSAQLKSLGEFFGEPLFTRSGNRIILSETGHVAFRYAEEIFSLGHELITQVGNQKRSGGAVLSIGVSCELSKTIAYRLLAPALRLLPRPRLHVVEDRVERLMTDLALRNLDLIMSDSPIPAGAKVKAFNHFLGQCSVSFLAERKVARKYLNGFPRSLDGAPFLLPTESASIRRDIDKWFTQNSLRPDIVAEFQDSALMKHFAHRGHGIILVPDIVADDVKQQHGLQLVGRAESIQERFYLISSERKIKHPAVRILCDYAARHTLA